MVGVRSKLCRHPIASIAWSAPGESGNDGIEETHAGAVEKNDCRMNTSVGGADSMLSRRTLQCGVLETNQGKKQAEQVPVRLQFRRDATGKVTRGEAPPNPHHLPADRRPCRVLRSCANSGRYFPRVSGVEMSGQGVEGANGVAFLSECDVRRAVETRRGRSAQWKAGRNIVFGRFQRSDAGDRGTVLCFRRV